MKSKSNSNITLTLTLKSVIHFQAFNFSNLAELVGAVSITLGLIYDERPGY